MNIKAIAARAAKLTVHKMPSPPPPKKGSKAEAVPTPSNNWMMEKPRLRLNSKQLPGIKDMQAFKAGEEFVMVLRAKMTGYNQDEYMHGEAEATFEILEIGLPPKK